MNERNESVVRAPEDPNALGRYVSRLSASASDYAYIKGLLVDIVRPSAVQGLPMPGVAMDIARHVPNATSEDELQKMVMGELTKLPLDPRTSKGQATAVSRKIATRLWTSFGARARGDPRVLADPRITNLRYEARRDLLRLLADRGGSADTLDVLFGASLESDNPIDALWDFDFLVRHGFVDDQRGPWTRSGRMMALTPQGTEVLKSLSERQLPGGR